MEAGAELGETQISVPNLGPSLQSVGALVSPRDVKLGECCPTSGLGEASGSVLRH